MKIDDVVMMYETASQKRGDLGKELSALTASLADLKEKMDEAEAGGDLSSFKALREEYEDTQFKIRAIRNRLARPQYDCPEIKKAWSGYAVRHNKAFSAKMDAFRKKVSALAEDYKELALMQNDAQEKRHCCRELLSSAGERNIEPIETLPVDDWGKNPDISFFELYGAMTAVEGMNVQLIKGGSVVNSLTEGFAEVGERFQHLYNIK